MIEGKEKAQGVICPYGYPVPFYTPDSGPKWSQSVHNDVPQTYKKLRWHWHSFLNRNDVLKKQRSYNGMNLIKLFFPYRPSPSPSARLRERDRRRSTAGRQRRRPRPHSRARERSEPSSIMSSIAGMDGESQIMHATTAAGSVANSSIGWHAEWQWTPGISILVARTKRIDRCVSCVFACMVCSSFFF
jgi:hypothetical protein